MKEKKTIRTVRRVKVRNTRKNKKHNLKFKKSQYSKRVGKRYKFHGGANGNNNTTVPPPPPSMPPGAEEGMPPGMPPPPGAEEGMPPGMPSPAANNGTSQPLPDEELSKLLEGTLSEEEQEELIGNTIEKSKVGSETDDKTYYDKLSLQDQIDISNMEGLYLPGIDVISTLNYILETLSLTPEERQTKAEGRSVEDITGEYVNSNFDNVVSKLGYRDEKNKHKKLKPEEVLSDTSTFNNIIREGKKFSEDDNIHVKDLLDMVRMLYKYKYSNEQWVRVASLIETLYQYYGSSMTREIFFNSNKVLDYSILKNIEEYWKTDFIFMTEFQRKKFINNLSFYGDEKTEIASLITNTNTAEFM